MEEPVNQAEAAATRESPWLPARPPHPVAVALTLAARGSGLWLLIAAGLAARPGRPRRAARRAVASVAVASASSHLIGKLFVRRRRPHAANVPARRALPERPDSSSFPSAHAATAAAFTTALALEAPHLGAAVAPVAAVVAYTRARTRVHWPTDVLAGALLGAGVAAAVTRLARSG